MTREKPLDIKGNVQNVMKREYTNKTRTTSVQHWVVAENVTTLLITSKEDVGGAENMGEEQQIRTPALPQRETRTTAMGSGQA